MIRDGREQTVPASTLVKGDLVHIQIGDKVPADLRVIWAANAKVINTKIRYSLSLARPSVQSKIFLLDKTNNLCDFF